MEALSSELVAFVAMLGLAGGGWFLAHAARMGFDYMSTRGNPRSRAQAHESGRDLLIGAAILAACVGTTALAVFGVFRPF